MKHLNIKSILLFALTLFFFNTNAQTYYKKLRYESGHFSQPLPRGYSFYVNGSIAPSDNHVMMKIQEAGGTPQYYFWKRTNDMQTEFEIFVSHPLKHYAVYTYKVLSSSTDKTKTKADLISDNFTPTALLAEPADTTDKPKNRGSRWGLVTGVGYAFLGKGSSKGNDMFGYVAAKFIISRRVDKTEKFSQETDENGGFSNRVYKTGWDRFSVLFGGATTPLAYKGKELTSPVYNIKPVLGLSFDFSPEISLDGGCIFYDYHKGNSTLYSDLDYNVGVGLFVSVSIDIDVFTRLKLAMAGKPYDQSAK